MFGETMAYYGRIQQQGEIAGVEPFFLEPHGGDLGGFFLVRGDRDQLAGCAPARSSSAWSSGLASWSTGSASSPRSPGTNSTGNSGSSNARRPSWFSSPRSPIKKR